MVLLTGWQMLIGSVPLVIIAFGQRRCPHYVALTLATRSEPVSYCGLWVGYAAVPAEPVRWTSYFIGIVIYNFLPATWAWVRVDAQAV